MLTASQRLRFALLMPVGAVALLVRDTLARVVAPKSSIARTRRAAEKFQAAFLSQIYIETGKLRVEAQLALPDRQPRALVLLCHGIGERFCFWREVQHILRSAGVASLLFHYPGYGRSSGFFTPENVDAGAHAAHAYLHDLAPGVPLFVFGTSLGTAVAARLAAELDPAPSGVILAQGFTTLREAAKAVLRVVRLPTALHRLLPDVWQNTEALAHTRSPVLILHGASDQLFPVAMAEDLYRSAQTRTDGRQSLLTPSGFDHSDAMLGERVELYWQPILDFICVSGEGRQTRR